MSRSAKLYTIVLGVAAAAFLATPNGPLGTFWRPHATVAMPVGVQGPLFMLLAVAEALALGVAVAFLLYGYPAVSAHPTVPRSTARAAHLSIVWLLGNWWAHDSLHLHNGLELGGLLAIEYAFHVTLMVAGLFLLRFFLAVVRVPATA